MTMKSQRSFAGHKLLEKKKKEKKTYDTWYLRQW